MRWLGGVGGTVGGPAAVEHSQLSRTTKPKEAEQRKQPSFKALGHMVVVAMRWRGAGLGPKGAGGGAQALFGAGNRL